MRKFVIVIFYLINQNVNAQNIDETIILADKMYDEEDYAESLDLYKRAIFFTNENKGNLYIKSGDCNYQQQDYSNAINHYDSATVYFLNKEELIDLYFKKAECYIFNEKYFEAERFILSKEFNYSNEQILKRNFYLGIIYFGEENFVKSEEYFVKSVSDTSNLIKLRIQDVFSHKRDFKSPIPKVAGLLSIILPGSGQLYAGDYKNAINSFLLVAVFAAIGTDMYIRYAWYDSLISVFPWFFRYYNGGIENAKNVAEHKRQQKRNKKLNELIILIQKEGVY